MTFSKNFKWSVGIWMTVEVISLGHGNRTDTHFVVPTAQGKHRATFHYDEFKTDTKH
jgi:hypothetical protein